MIQQKLGNRIVNGGSFIRIGVQVAQNKKPCLRFKSAGFTAVIDNVFGAFQVIRPEADFIVVAQLVALFGAVEGRGSGMAA